MQRQSAKKHGQMIQLVGGGEAAQPDQLVLKPLASDHTHTPKVTWVLGESEEPFTAVCRKDTECHCHSIWRRGPRQGQSCPRHSPHWVRNRALKGFRPTPLISSRLLFPSRSKDRRQQWLSICLLASCSFLLSVLAKLGHCAKKVMF